jgi:hypothetical protein
MSATPPAPLGPDWKPWGERLVNYMTRVRSQLATFVTGDKATDDGILVWDRTGYPVVSKNGEFRQIVLADGYAQLVRTTSQTAAVINTAYPIGWDSLALSDGITLDPADSTKIVFAEGGKFILSFTAELKSSSGSTKGIWIWPRVNGVDYPGSTMKTTLHQSNQDIVVSRTAIFEMQAGQYLQAMFAVDDVNIWIDAPAATAFAPSAPAATLSITRYMQ